MVTLRTTRKITVDKDAFIRELQSLAAAEKDKQAELQEHIREMEEQGYDLSEYKAALTEKIGGATADEVARAKKEALGTVTDKYEDKGKVGKPNSNAVSDDYDSNAHVMRGCGEVDGRPNCDHQCKLCYRKHCKWREE